MIAEEATTQLTRAWATRLASTILRREYSYIQDRESCRCMELVENWHAGLETNLLVGIEEPCDVCS